MDMALRSLSNNAGTQFPRRKRPDDTTFGMKPFRKSPEEEAEEEKLKKTAEFRHHKLPGFHIIA